MEKSSRFVRTVADDCGLMVYSIENEEDTAEYGVTNRSSGAMSWGKLIELEYVNEWT